jgi:predicted deacylase
MFGKRRLTLITYFLAAAVFLLSTTGDGSTFLQRLGRLGSEKTEAAPAEVVSVHTEKVIMGGTPWETVLYIISSPKAGPVVMVIGGIHGDEPAGYLAADSIATWSVDRGTLLVLPRANVPAIADRKRNVPGGTDLNRAFPGNRNSENQTEKLAAAIFEIIQEHEPHWVIDLHEAQNFERELPGALGQTLIYPGGARSTDIVSELLAAVNRTINLEEHHFLILRGAAGGSVIEAVRQIGSEALIVETCQQMMLSERIRYHRQAVSSLLYLLGVTVY